MDDRAHDEAVAPLSAAAAAVQKAKRPERERKKVARFELLHSMTVGASTDAQSIHFSSTFAAPIV